MIEGVSDFGVSETTAWRFFSLICLHTAGTGILAFEFWANFGLGRFRPKTTCIWAIPFGIFPGIIGTQPRSLGYM